MTAINIHTTHNSASSVNSIAEEILGKMAKQFPVCLSSDEFHFFPHAKYENHNWSGWDNFSQEATQEMVGRISKWDQLLLNCEAENLSLDDLIDVRIMRHIIKTISEQLSDIGVHRSQPSFYLTILGIGLAEAVDGGLDTLDKRLNTIPEFLDRAASALQRIPRIFRDLGCEMIIGFKPWLYSLAPSASSIHTAIEALDRFKDHLINIPTTEEFLLPPELYERVAFHHMDCGLNMEEISWQLDQELRESEKILKKYAAVHDPDLTWQGIIDSLEQPELANGDVKQIYESIISDLASHCITEGLISADLVKQCPVSVEEIPAHLQPVRSGAAFSMPPGHPPKGGTFFIMTENQGAPVTSDLKLLAAHETFPGHQMLDSYRWSLERPVRRHIEFPIYYEGWASFSEELLFETGFFKDQSDWFLLAKRRFWRAMRGRVDFDIHTGKRSIEEAANFLKEHGMEYGKALAMLRRYILKPGYQLAYTIGRRRFNYAYEKSPDPISFTHQVMSMGEIGFDNLEKVLESGG